LKNPKREQLPLSQTLKVNMIEYEFVATINKKIVASALKDTEPASEEITVPASNSTESLDTTLIQSSKFSSVNAEEKGLTLRKCHQKYKRLLF
jgi:hypothetical protein